MHTDITEPRPRPRRLILHIGMPKTGSTAIQRAFARQGNNPSLAYVRLPGSVDCNDLFSVFSQRPQTYHLHRKFARGADEIQRFNDAVREHLQDAFRQSTAATTLVSAEALVSLDEQEVLQLQQFLAGFFTDITVAGYVRTPRGAMESGFQQSVQGKDEPLAIAGFYPAYRWKFEKFDKAFGRENVQLWKFEPAMFPGNDVVSDFCARLSMPLPAHNAANASRNMTLQADTPRDNESLPLAALQALYAYRKYFPYGSGDEAIAWNDRIITRLRTLGGAKLRFAATAIKPVLAAHADDMAWIEARIGASLADDLAARADDVGCEADLLDIRTGTLVALRALTNEPADLPADAPADTGDPGQTAAALVERLRLRLVDEQREQAAVVARFHDLVRVAKTADPTAFHDMLEVRAASLLQGAFAHILHTLTAAGSGKVVVDGLGVFHLAEHVAATEGDTPREILFTAQAAGHPVPGAGNSGAPRKPRTT